MNRNVSLKLVIYPALEPSRFKRVERATNGMKVINASTEDEALREIIDADALLGKVTPELLAASTKLRWVQSMTASLEHYIFPALVTHPSQLTNMRGLYSDIIADHVFGYILCFARNLHSYIRNQIDARWSPAGGEKGRSNFVSGPGVTSSMDRAHLHLSDQTLGIIGMGNIGMEVAQRGVAFGMCVRGVDAVKKKSPPGVEAIWSVDKLSTLLAESDFVVVAAPHTPETIKLFQKSTFRLMKKTAYFINVGRGAIVDLDDLADSIEMGVIAGAGLDVFEIEPLPPKHPLWRMENVIITPHVAGASPRIAERHLNVLMENVKRFIDDRPLMNIVDKSRWF
tara:strand:+ start:12508 stop:13527 length:1020 start_codon:yes stop_codon:yes gene_type:complete